MDNEENNKERKINSLEELELANIPDGEIYEVADLLANEGKDEK